MARIRSWNQIESDQRIGQLERDLRDMADRVEDLHQFLSNRHAVEVQTSNRRPYARCSCGWTSGVCRGRGEAEICALEHVRVELEAARK